MGPLDRLAVLFGHKDKDTLKRGYRRGSFTAGGERDKGFAEADQAGGKLKRSDSFFWTSTRFSTRRKKVAPSENNRLGGNGVVSKNGGPANNHAGNARGGNAVVLLQRQHMPMATVEAPPPTTADAMVETVSSPIPTPKGPPPIPPKLLEELKQSATRIEALLALIQYLVVDLDAFSTPSLKKAVEGYKTEVINAKLNLDEAVATCQRLMEEKELSEARHKENINELLRKNEENIKELEAKLNSQVEETQLRYEEELKRRDRLNNRNMESLLEDLKLYVERAEKADKQVEDGMRELEIVKKEKEDILAREMDLKQLNTRLQSEIADLTEKLRKETVIKAGDCGKHRDEIQSLQAVLDLKTKELHDHRKKLEELKQKSDALNPALARNAALQARVEDLEVQLQRKVASERKLQERVRHLSENVERESRQNEQLALENEVLEWKINESSKLMASFSGQSDMSSSMTGSMMASSSPSSDRRSNSIMAISMGSPDSPPNFAFPRFSPRLSPKSPFSDVSGTIELEEEEDDMEDEDEDKVKAGGGRGGGEEEEEGDEEDDDEDDEEEEDDIKLSFESLPITPKVRTLVEKNESISWLVEMEEVIPASSLLQSAGMRRSNPQQSSPLNLLPQMIPELPPLASNSPSTSPTSSDPSSSVFRGSGKGKVSPTQQHLVRRGSAQQPVKKTRPERGKLAGHGMMYSSTPSGHHHLTTSLSHGHHHRRYHHHHHQPRSTSRLPPSDSPMCSARSRSVSTDSESLEAEEASAAANARLAELKAWRSGAKAFACTSGGERALQPLQKSGDEEDGGKKDKEGDWEVNGDAKFSEGRLVEEGSRGDTPPGPKPPTPMGIDRDSPSKNGSPFCDFGEDFSDQSPFRGKFEVNGTSLNPMEDSSSSVEITLETTPKKQPTSLQPSQGSSPGGTQASAPLTFPTKQFMPTSEASPSHQMVHHHYQPRHVLSSLCAHPHLAIKESAGEAMISEEISDDTQGESDDEDNRAEGKLLEDSDEDDELEGVEVGLGHVMLQNRLEVIGVPDVVPMPVAKPSVTTPVRENGKETKSSNPEVQEEQTAGNTLKLGQQLLSSSTPDSSQFPHTDSSVMDLSWSEDLDLMPSESEV